ncbi:MAG: class I SAM-dependent methyltransferase [Pseudomonadota bacterium]
MRKFNFPPDRDIAEDLAQSFGYTGDLVDIYTSTKGTLIHKWHHYLPLYDRYFGPWRGKPVRFLEIGVSRGGSLSMWRRWFGPEAVIFGIDINPRCRVHDGIDGQVRIGSQDDPKFLKRVVEEMGGVDIVLDDGSHQMAHVRASLEVLFPQLTVGGVYMIEDLHTAYMSGFGGGLESPDNFFRLLNRLIDDMHRWYHPQPMLNSNLGRWMTGFHVHDSIVVIDKAPVLRPTTSKVGP